MARHLSLAALSLAVSLALVSCSKQSSSTAGGGSGGEITGPDTGGSLGTGGSPGTGGSLDSGGNVGTGSSPGSGGVVSNGTGGRRGSTSASGGASGSTGRDGTGGSLPTGGADAGSAGAPGSGGTTGSSTAGNGGSAGSSQGGSTPTGGTGGTTPTPTFTFFVTSDKSKTGNLGGLKAADQRCQSLATAVGQGEQTWHAYLSVESDPDSGNGPVDARDRIGNGPFYNSKGVLLAEDLDALHLLKGDADLFLDEQGNKVPGNWGGSPTPNEHDILTGSQADGTLAAGKTCGDWTSADSSKAAVVGHSDGLGPGGAATGNYTSWNASHDNGSCADTAPKGGAGRIYCFAVH